MPADLTMPTFSSEFNVAPMATIRVFLSHLVLEGAESGGSLAGLGRGKGGGRAEDGSEAGGGLHVYERVCWNCDLEGEARSELSDAGVVAWSKAWRASSFKAKDLLICSGFLFINQISSGLRQFASDRKRPPPARIFRSREYIHVM